MTLSRPEVLNALDAATLRCLEACVSQVVEKPRTDRMGEAVTARAAMMTRLIR